jgi:hypothetical protein
MSVSAPTVVEFVALRVQTVVVPLEMRMVELLVSDVPPALKAHRTLAGVARDSVKVGAQEDVALESPRPFPLPCAFAETEPDPKTVKGWSDETCVALALAEALPSEPDPPIERSMSERSG